MLNVAHILVVAIVLGAAVRTEFVRIADAEQQQSQLKAEVTGLHVVQGVGTSKASTVSLTSRLASSRCRKT